jgi:hypothetical protein
MTMKLGCSILYSAAQSPSVRLTIREAFDGSESRSISFQCGAEPLAKAVACHVPPMSRYDFSDCDTWEAPSDNDAAHASTRGS